MAPANKVAAAFVLCIAFGLPVTAAGVAVTVPGRVWIPLALAGFLWVIILNVWGFHRPKYFGVVDEGLWIVWPLRRRLIERHKIVEVRRIPRDEAGLPARLLGAEGFFGTFGLCRSPQIGLMRAYVTDRDALVLIRRRGYRPLLISPRRPDDFVAAWRRGPGADSPAGDAPSAGEPPVDTGGGDG